MTKHYGSHIQVETYDQQLLKRFSGPCYGMKYAKHELEQHWWSKLSEHFNEIVQAPGILIFTYHSSSITRSEFLQLYGEFYKPNLQTLARIGLFAFKMDLLLMHYRNIGIG